MCKRTPLKYNLSVNTYTETIDVPVQRPCNGFTVTNLGDTALKINGKILFPSATPLTAQGDSVTFGGNAEEVYTDKIYISFLLPLGAAPLCEVIQKYYVSDTFE